jgi:hypothetical protein
MMQSPAQRINLALQQAQLIQNSLQNAYNLAVQVPLGRTAKLQARIQKCITLLSTRLSKANLVNTYVPNYATALTPTINQFANALGGTLFSGFGNSNTGGYTAGGQAPRFGYGSNYSGDGKSPVGFGYGY